LRIIRKPGVTEEFTLSEVLVLPGNAWCRLIRVPLQGFGKIPAAMCGSFPAGPPNTPARFRYAFFATGGYILEGQEGGSAKEVVRAETFK
jgi:hypothetical protein